MYPDNEHPQNGSATLGLAWVHNRWGGLLLGSARALQFASTFESNEMFVEPRCGHIGAYPAMEGGVVVSRGRRCVVFGA